MIRSWLRTFLSEAFFQYGPKGLMWWQWLAIPAAALIALAIGRPLGIISRSILRRIFKKTRTEWDDRLFERVGGGLSILWAIAAFRVMLPLLELPPWAAAIAEQILAALVVVTAFWALFRTTDVFFQIMLGRAWAADNPSARSLMSFMGNFTRAAIAVLGVIATIGALGFPVATVLAGVGIGGIALAFGAQKTVENLFGSVALATDQPLRVGDLVKIDDVTGTVEVVGTRSTRIRTPDRSLVTYPNGRLADMRIETFAPRDRIRFVATVGVIPTTTEAQLSQVIRGMETVLREHPGIWPDAIAVRFSGFGAHALEIEVQCWFQTEDVETFKSYRQDVLFGFMRAIERAGTAVAIPTHTIQVVAQGAPPVSKQVSGNPS